MKTGTRIEVRGLSMSMTETWESARIVKTTADMHPIPDGYHPVLFEDGNVALMVHENSFRVVDNR